MSKKQIKIPYHPFKHFSYRVPILPKSELRATDCISTFKSSIFKEAVFLASPDLYRELDKWVKGELQLNEAFKLELAMLKYLLRMSSRCTPFGLFAGCNAGTIGEINEIILSDTDKHNSNTRLDMNYLCNLIKDIGCIQKVQKQLKYYPNSSLYESGENYRYIEYKYIKGRRKHYLTSIEKDSYLKLVLENAGSGALVHDLSELLIDDEILFEEAKEYVHELVNNQILVSELEPTVSGENLILRLIDKLEGLEIKVEILKYLKGLNFSLNQIDITSIGRPVNLYESIIKSLKEKNTEFEPKYLFQSDLRINAKRATIKTDLVNSVFEGIRILNILTPKNENQNLKKFKDDFLKRYEEQEVPLVDTLDIETGIGFADKGNQSGDINPLLDDLRIIRNGNVSLTINLTPQALFIQQKYEEYISNPDKTEIKITEDEVKNLPEDWDDVPNTIQAMFEVLTTNLENNAPKIRMISAGGSSAANLLGRFCHISDGINHLVQEITEKDQKLEKERILAEIIHLPESRTGNILFRPTIREYEIPYLANHSVDNAQTIPITDIMISVSNRNGIKLRSKKLDKEIIPRLTTAHNYWSNSLPIYHFLSSIQTQNLRAGFIFSWGFMMDNKPFLPRVIYKNIILSPSIWNIKASDTKDIPKITDIGFYNAIQKLKTEKNIPNRVLYVQGDNKLLIDFNHKLSVQLLFNEVKKRDFRLEEYLFTDEDSFVKRNNESFTNQLILCFYKNHE